MRRLLAVFLASILVAAMSGTALAAPGGQSGDHAMMFYMSLGDSLAAGVQPTGDPTNMYRTNQGYADQLLRIARSEYPKLQLIKLGCPGETTVTFTEGGICPYGEGSQLAQALVLLKAHQGRIAFITIDIGWNDFKCDPTAPDPAACVPPGIASVAAHLPGILQALREAAPGVPIVGGTLYDPFLALWLQPGGQALAGLSTALIGTVNAAETAIYAAFQVPVADVQGAFGTNDWTPTAVVTPFGPLPQNVANICAWTWVCSAFHDEHANAAGYHVMADAFWAQLD